MRIKSAKDLTVFQKAYALAMEIFQVSKVKHDQGPVFVYPESINFRS